MLSSLLSRLTSEAVNSCINPKTICQLLACLLLTSSLGMNLQADAVEQDPLVTQEPIAAASSQTGVFASAPRDENDPRVIAEKKQAQELYPSSLAAPKFPGRSPLI